MSPDQIKKLKKGLSNPNISEAQKEMIRKKLASVDVKKEEPKKAETPSPKIMHSKGSKRYVHRQTLNSDYVIGDEVVLLQDVSDADILKHNSPQVRVKFVSSGVEKTIPLSGLGRSKPKKEESKPKKSDGRSKRKGQSNPLFELAKKIRKEGESWGDAVKRAGKELSEKKKPTKSEKKPKRTISRKKKETVPVAKKKARVIKRSKRQSGSSDTERDKQRTAMASGKRISREGNVYYEYRKNRTDLNKKNKL